jgi:SsrA-binding protein
VEKGISIKNKRASHEYLLLQDFTAGIQLYGTEIKSIREGKASIVDAYRDQHAHRGICLWYLQQP